MNKRDLRKVQDPEINLEGLVQGKWNFHLHLTEAAGEQVLVAYVFDFAAEAPKFKVFLWGGSYTSLKREGVNYVWTGASTTHLLGSSYSKYLGCYDGRAIQILNPEAIEGANDFLKTKGGNIYRDIDRFQEEVRRARLDRRDLKITERIDKEMAKVPGLPKGFKEWAQEEVLYRGRYLIYKNSGQKILKGFCTHCDSEVEIEREGCRHNAHGACPNCHSVVTYKSEGKTTKRIDDYEDAAILQPFGDGFILRYFLVGQKIYKGQLGAGGGYREVSISERARDIYPGGDKACVMGFEYTIFKQRVERWCDSTGVYNCRHAVLYPFNVREVLKDTDYKYSALEQIAVYQHAYSFDVKGFLEQYPRHRCYEYLIKMGLCNIVRGLIGQTHPQYKSGVDLEGKGPMGVLGIEKYDIPILQKTQADLTGLEYVKYARGSGTKLQGAHIRFIQENFNGSLGSIVRFCEHTTMGRAIKYIKEDGRARSKAGYRERANIWGDYIDMAKKLRYDLKDGFILFPANLKQAHDIAVKIINEEKDKERYKEENKKNASVAKMEAKLNQQYYFENEKYFIRAPHDAAEIVREGQSLHHCVAGYTDRVAKGETVVLFLRNKEDPDRPYYTIEIKKGKIAQWHGKFNDANNPKPKEVIEFVKKFDKEKVDQKKEKRTA